MKLIVFSFICMLSIACNNIRYPSQQSQIVNSGVVNIDSLKIDSIVVYTAVFVPVGVFYSFNRYIDSLFCNYDKLMKQAKSRKQVYKCNNGQFILDSIWLILSKNRLFVQQLHSQSTDTMQTYGIKKCHIESRAGISDLFEIYIGKKMIRLGVCRDNYYIIYHYCPTKIS